MEERGRRRGEIEERRGRVHNTAASSYTAHSLLFNSFLLFTIRYGQGTRDMAGPSGLTTEAFINKVRQDMVQHVMVCCAALHLLYNVI
jgi:hypothetical protein